MSKVTGFRCVLADQTSTMPELIDRSAAVTYIKEKDVGQEPKNSQSVEVEGKFGQVVHNGRKNVVPVKRKGAMFP